MHALDLHIVGLTPGKALGPRLHASAEVDADEFAK
jgi:hypothetical protein